jgi:hypothetical protein
MKRILKRPDGDEVFATITFEKENNLVCLDWNGYLTAELVKRGSEELLNVLTETSCNRILVDNRKVSGPWQAANQWYETDWNPRAVRVGPTRMAVIMSEDIFSRFSLYSDPQTTRGIQIACVFDGDQPARKWLRESLSTAA